MAKLGPIVIVEDDCDDQEIMESAIQSIGNKNPIHFFDNGQKVLNYLYTTTEQPFIIISDINIPQINGIQLREAIQKDEFLKSKGIPFVFLSTDASPLLVRKAYDLTVQGFFKKPSSMNEIKNMLAQLFGYWELCKHPHNC